MKQNTENKMENTEIKPDHYYRNKNGKLAYYFTMALTTDGQEQKYYINQYNILLENMKKSLAV